MRLRTAVSLFSSRIAGTLKLPDAVGFSLGLASMVASVESDAERCRLNGVWSRAPASLRRIVVHVAASSLMQTEKKQASVVKRRTRWSKSHAGKARQAGQVKCEGVTSLSASSVLLICSLCFVQYHLMVKLVDRVLSKAC